MMNLPTLEELAKKVYISEEDPHSPVKPSEAQFMYRFIKEHKLSKTLEVGFAFARSASHIMSATGATHIAMDPFQSNYGNQGLKNIESLGLSDQLDFRPDFSHNVLPQLLKENQTFDFIFIDGDHKFDGEFIDFYYADLLLQQGGFVVLHDTWMRSTALVMGFIENSRKDYKKVASPLRNLAVYQKVAADTRNGMHFAEFYTLKSLFTHPIIIWLTSGKPSFLKKIIFGLKAFVKRFIK